MSKNSFLPLNFSTWLVHGLTASGVIPALFSMMALIDGNATACVLWLFVALFIDGIDGPISRKVKTDVKKVGVDGVLLDLVVDYLTYVFIPAIFMWKFGLFPEGISVLLVSVILFSGVLYFARTDMKTNDKWFTGFPASWNFVVFSLSLLGTPDMVNAVAVVGFAILSATSVETFHVFRSKQLRKTTVSITMVYLVSMVSMVLIDGQLDNSFGRVVIVVWFTYYIATAIWKTWIYKSDLKSKIQADHSIDR